ncbi:MAG TPA: efflux RND transporter permease subunit, partial [Bradyrhizobium sp.]|nr:efflux RND transporter permease subunit [Bradyrhizobium sp.]
PGADPQTMGATVASPLELQFGEIPGLTQMTSSSALGYTQITLQFELSRNLDGAVSDTLSAIQTATAYLPKNMPYPPMIRKVNPADTPILVLGVSSDSLPITTVDAYAQNILMQKISQVSGVGLVGVGGQVQPAVRVQVDPAALAARGINLEDVRTVLGQANVDLPKGQLNSPRQTFTLNTNDQLFDPEKYADLIVAYRNGSPVRIRDIGRAISAGQNELIAGWENNKRAVILAVQRQPGANVVETVQRIKKMMPVLQASIPAAVKIDVVSDRTQTIRASIDDVQFTLILTVALVVMVIFVFLRSFWATIIPAVTVPLSLVGTFAVLYEMGYSLDNLSLMALSIAVGFVVDDAVVEIENITRHIEEGMSPYDAAMKGSGEIGFTVVAITFSLIAVFIPLFLMSGYVGLLFREFAMTVSVALLLSLVISRTLTPMMCAYLLKPESHEHGPLYRFSERCFDGLLHLYEAGLKIVLRHRFITLMVMLGTVLVTGYLYVIIPKGFFPQQDTGLIIGQSEAAQDISYQAMTERQQAMLDVIMKDPAVDSVAAATGAGGGLYTLNDGRVFIQLKPKAKRGPIDEVMARLHTNLAKVQGITLYMQAAQDITIGARLNKTQFQYTLNDADPGELNHWTDLFYQKIKALPSVTDVATDQLNAGPLLDITIKRDVASSYGILPYTIDNTLDDAFGQRIVSTIYTTLQQYHVVLEVSPKFQYSPDALSNIYVKSSSGQQVPISTLVDSAIKVAPLVVNHTGQFPSVTISFNLAPGAAIGQAVNNIHAVEAELHPPLSLQTSFQGNAQAFGASLKSTPILILASLFVIYLILGMLYESMIHPITIISTLPSAGVGALLLLMAAHFDLSVIAIVGIILLIGIVKKNGIMLVDFALQAEQTEGLNTEEAIYQACIKRFRPILMTTMAALLGAVPMMVGTGVGSEIRQPLGYAIVGGLALSQVLTLYTTPVVYLYLDRLQIRLFGEKHQANPSIEPPPAPAE